MLVGLLIGVFVASILAPPPLPMTAAGDTTPRCGTTLPLFAAEVSLARPVPDRPAMPQIVPSDARPALERIVDSPQTVGLVAYRVGEEEKGIYLNADIPYPIASTVKIIHLYAYAKAFTSGQLSPETLVPLADIARYYFPNTDGGAHPAALREIYQNGQTVGEPSAVYIGLVPRMMIRHSSNAATDYLHDFFGQELIEQSALELDMTSQTAPCPFLGQFLSMSNTHRADQNDTQAITALRQDPAAYGVGVMALMQEYIEDETFRLAQLDWWQEERRPSVRDQHYFTQTLSVRGSARDYAAVMARIVSADFANPALAQLMRYYLEWPMEFPANQALFQTLGYKGGNLPGTYTGVYYGVRAAGGAPIVVALFYSDLPMSMYRDWRGAYPHDELARWILTDPAALDTLRTYLAAAITQ